MSFTPNNIAVFGSNGSIGNAFCELFSKNYPNAKIHAFARQKQNNQSDNINYHLIDYENEENIKEAAFIVSKPVDLVIVASGILHVNGIMPEKSSRELAREKFQQLFEVNVIIPALLGKYFLPNLNDKEKSVFAFLSARVGSISDNKLGGWHSYRASKAALNMLIKNFAIEIGRRNKNSIIIGLHPGTVASNLSEPFQKNVPKDKLFTPNYSASKMTEVIEKLKINDNGKIFAWDGMEIQP